MHVSSASRVRAVAMLAGLVASLNAPIALAGPDGAQVVRGNVNISRDGNTTLIRASNGAIINYNTFNIAGHETVRFLQPDAASRVLNRIQGAGPSRIDGSLLANGRVYIVNPAGVVFGKNAVVNVGGLYAAAGNMSDRDFLSRTDRFTNLQGHVANNGSITTSDGGTVVLAGSSVLNTGSIVAPQGTIAMAAGQDVIVSQRNGNIYTRVEGAAADVAGGSVQNTGTIDARKGQAFIAAGDTTGLAINMGGSTRARKTTVQAKGDVVVSGAINARDQNQQTVRGRALPAKGGEVTIAGERVAIVGANIDASGSSGGGSVTIGRATTDVGAASAVAISDASTINASGTQGNAEGGKVDIWSDTYTNSHAAISARGSGTGSGGFIETSSKGTLQVDGSRIDAASDAGKGGTWLLDPRNVRIQSNPTSNGAFDAGTPDIFTPTGDDSIVDAADINSRLDAGTNVTINTGSTGTQDGNITIEADITRSAGSGRRTLRLEAANDITLANGIRVRDTSGEGTNVQFISNTGPNDPDPARGGIRIGDNAEIRTAGGDLLFAGGDGTTASLGDVNSDGFVSGIRASGARGSNGNAAGIVAGTGFLIDAGTGNVRMRGVGEDGGSNAAGVALGTGSIVGGSIVIDAMGGNVTNAGQGGGNQGFVDAGGTTLTATGAGGLVINGRGGNTVDASNVVGVTILGTHEADAGPITITGVGASGTGQDNYGVFVGGAATARMDGDANLTISGRANASGNANAGVLIFGSVLSSSLAGSGANISISGVSGTGTNATGVQVQGPGARVTNTNAGITIIGNSLGSGANSNGVLVTDSGAIEGLGARDVGITGIATDAAASGIATGTGTARLGSSTFTGNLLLVADRVQLSSNSSVVSQSGGSNSVSIRPSTPDTTIGVGTGAAGTLSLTDDELAVFSGWSRLQIGASGSGAVSTSNVNFAGLNADIVLRGASLATQGITLAGGRTLTLNIAGATTQSGAITASNLELRGGTGTYTLTNAGNDIGTLAANAGSVSLTDTGTLTIGSAGTTTGLTLTSIGTSTITTGTNLPISNAVNAGGGSLVLRADDAAINANISGSGTLEIAPSSVSTNMIVNADNGVDTGSTLDIDTDELARIVDGFGTVTFGRQDGTGLLRLPRATTFTDNAVFCMGGAGGRVDVEAAMRGQDASLRFVAGQLARFNGALVTNGRSITIDGPAQIVTNVLFDSTDGGAVAGGANIAFVALDADDANNGRILTVNAGQGNIDAFGAIGALQALQTATFTAASTSVRSVTTRANQTYNGSTFINGALSSSSSGRIDINGGLGVTGNSTINFDQGVRITGNGVSPTPSSLAITSSAGLIELSGLSGFGDLTFTSATGINAFGDISGAAVRFSGPLNLAQAVANQTTTITGGTSVLFENTVGSDSNVALVVASPLTTFSQAVGAGVNTIRSITTDAAGTTTLLANVTTTGNQNFGDRLLLGTDIALTSTTGSVNINGGADSDGGTARTLTISGPGGTILGGNIGSQAALATISVASNTPVTLAGAITTTTSQTYDGPVLIGGVTSLTAPTVSFNGTVNGTGSGATDLTVNAPSGSINFNAAVGNVQPIASIDLNGSSIVVNNITTTGSQRFNGSTRLLGNLASTGAGSIRFINDLSLETDATISTAGLLDTDDIVFGGRVDSLAQSSGAGRAFVVNAGLGDVTFSGDLGVQTVNNLTQLASLDVTGASISALVVRSQGSQFFNGNTNLRGNLTTTGSGTIAIAGETILANDITVTTNAGDIIFGGLLNSDTTARNLVVNTGGNGTTRFGGAVGENARLATLTTNTDGRTRIEGGVIRTTGDQVYGDAVTLAATTLLEGNDIFFTSTLDSDTRNTARNLTVNSAASGADTGETTFNAAVGATNRLGSITTNGEGQTRINGNVFSTRTQTYGDQVLIQRNLTLDSGAGGLFFRQTIDADGAATDPLLTLQSNANGVLDEINYRFGGNIGSSRRLGGITIGGDRAPTWASSVVFTDAWDQNGRIASTGVNDADAFTVTTGAGGITIGTGNKLLALGSLNLNSTGAIQFAEANVLRNLNVTSNTIRLARRLPGEVQDATIQTPRDQVIRDGGGDLVAGGAIDFSSRPTLVGVGAAPTVNVGSGSDAELSGLIFRQRTTPVTATTFRDPRSSGGTLLVPFDLIASGATNTNIATAANQSKLPEPQQGTLGANLRMARVPGAAAAEGLVGALQTLGLAAGQTSDSARIRALGGASIADALPESVGPNASRMSQSSESKLVNLTRVNGPALLAAASSFEAMSADSATLTSMKDTLSQSWERYTQRSMKPTGGGWRISIESQQQPDMNAKAKKTPADVTVIPANASDSKALQHLNTLQQFFSQLQEAGLSPGEALVPARKIIDAVKPDGMSERDFQAAVNGWMATFVVAE
jgi:filamentous hemagglutinin family protein